MRKLLLAILPSQDNALVIDLATLLVIVAVLILSALSLSFVFHLRGLRSHQLKDFNILWTVRLLLILFISCWVINEIIRLPSLFPLSANGLCKLHVVFSLGFLEPGYLITLLFIINQSLKEPTLVRELWSVISVLLMSLPTFILQIISVFFVKDSWVDGTCMFPLLSSILFGAFAVVYSMCLVFSCWRVGVLVINRNTRLRIALLGWTVIVSLLVQLVFLGVASSSRVWYLGVFVSLAVGACMAEIVLVVKPILEALVAHGDDCEWNPVVRYLESVEERKL